MNCSRVLAVLRSSALTLVCPEVMASVAILHMSWREKTRLVHLMLFKAQRKKTFCDVSVKIRAVLIGY